MDSFAKTQLNLYANVIELQKAGQGGAATCTWGFIDDSSIATKKLGEAINVANAADKDSKRFEGRFHMQNAAPKHVHEHVDALVKEAERTLEVRLALKNDSRAHEVKLVDTLAPHTASPKRKTTEGERLAGK